MKISRSIKSEPVSGERSCSSHDQDDRKLVLPPPRPPPPINRPSSLSLPHPSKGELNDTRDDQEFTINHGRFEVVIRQDETLYVPNILIANDNLYSDLTKQQILDLPLSASVAQLRYDITINECAELFCKWPGVIKIQVNYNPTFPANAVCLITFADFNSTVNFFKSHMFINYLEYPLCVADKEVATWGSCIENGINYLEEDDQSDGEEDDQSEEEEVPTHKVVKKSKPAKTKKAAKRKTAPRKTGALNKHADTNGKSRADASAQQSLDSDEVVLNGNSVRTRGGKKQKVTKKK